MYRNLRLSDARSRFGADVVDRAEDALIDKALSFGCTLAPHQILSAMAMRFMEERRHMQKTQNAGVTALTPQRYFAHDIGVLGMVAGSGKSLACSLLCATFAEVERDATLRFCTTRPHSFPPAKSTAHTHLHDHVVQRKLHRFCLRTLLVVPSGLKSQWVDALARQARFVEGTDFLVFTSFREDALDTLRDAAYAVRVGDEVGACDDDDRRAHGGPYVVIMTHTAYQQFIKHGAAQDECVFQRAIFDEADSLNIPGFSWAPAHFMWLVTASPDNLLHHHRVRTANLRLSATRDWMAWNAITVTCAEDEVARHIVLPPPARRTLFFRRSTLVSALESAMPTRAMEALEAGDVAGAAALMNCTSVVGEQGLVAAVTGRLAQDIQAREARAWQAERDADELTTD